MFKMPMHFPVIGLTLLLLALSQPTLADDRVALVIGNSAYQHAPRLNNPLKDARDIAAALERLGFEVTRLEQTGKAELERQLAAFRERTRSAERALLYYAGHAIQVDGRNHLVPVDAEVRDLADVGLRLVGLDEVLAQLQGRINVVILDACRDNPFAEALSRSASRLGRTFGSPRGLVRDETLLARGAYLMMAAGPGAVAEDGPPGGNSPFAAELLTHLETPGLELSQLHRRVRAGVEQRTGRRQSPEAIDRLPPEPIYLAGGSLRTDAPATAARGTLTIHSQPPGATIHLDGALLGEAPQTYPAPREGAQQVELEARLDGYRSASERVWLRAGQDSSVRLLLQADAAPPPTVEPPPSALTRLSVRATPADARVRIMNIVPVYRDGIELEPGRYDIEVSAPGHRTYRRWHALADGEQVVEVTLNRVETAAASPTPPAVSGGVRPGSGSVHRDRLGDGSEGPAMVFIEGGTFTMGSPANETGRFDNERRHRVTVGDFHIGRYAVTFDEYDRFARATGRGLPNDRGWGRGRRPVINVNWYDATAYAEWLSQQTGQQYRLPTEAEWEYACRAGGRHRYCGGDDVDAVAWYRDNSGGRTRPVGEKQPNAWGLYDMSGNVWEWTCSEYDRDYGGAETLCESNNRSNASRVLRGGSWNDFPSLVRSALRTWYSPGYRFHNRGFRLARSP